MTIDTLAQRYERQMRCLLPEVDQHRRNTADAVLSGYQLAYHHVDPTLCWQPYGTARCTKLLGHDGLHEDDRPGDGIPGARWIRTTDGKVLGWSSITSPTA